jgi:DNA polymerase I-like protein with 3'-5' exonuclease and polymerase domains
MFLRNLGVKIALQYHDEILFNIKLGREKEVEKLISKAMQQVNDKLKLNVKVGCSVQFGRSYSECH